MENNDIKNEVVTFKIEEETAEKEESTVSYTVTPVGDEPEQAADAPVQSALASNVTDAGKPAVNTAEYPAGYDINAPKISATGKSRDYKREIIMAVLAVVVCPLAIYLGMKFEGYKTVCFLIAAMGVLTAGALVRHILTCRKVNELLSSGKCNTVSGLMAELKIKKKPDFVRTLGGMIREGHLTGYEITGDELITKTDNIPPEEPKKLFDGIFGKKK